MRPLKKQYKNTIAVFTRTAGGVMVKKGIETKFVQEKLRELIHVGIALSAEHNIDDLLDLILTKARELTNADAGSLYLIEHNEEGEPASLKFILFQNDSLDIALPTEFNIPIDTESIAGFVAFTGQILNLPNVYEIPSSYPFHFNRSLDEKTGYRTRSMLTVPMVTPNKEIIGVVQLINRKKERILLRKQEDFDEYVIPFDEHDVELVHALASQAAVSLHNRQLLFEIENLFESFIRAAVLAVEQRDPTTKGHSVRVAHLTVEFAKAVTAWTSGPYARVSFHSTHLKELYYAGILHDFGKIGVREFILLKSKKLFPEDFTRIQYRFQLALKDIELEKERKKLATLLRMGTTNIEPIFEIIEASARNKRRELEELWELVLQLNEPSVVREKVHIPWSKLSSLYYIDASGSRCPIFEKEDIVRLSIPKGSLSPEERHEIESHVQRSYEFLRQIPWTRTYRNVPEIVYAHHEKLDGSGYPRGLRKDDIPIQTRMMTICDIFDALCAQDRPYKPAVTIGRALEILECEVHEGKLDRDLFHIFHEKKIWQTVPHFRNKV